MSLRPAVLAALCLALAATARAAAPATPAMPDKDKWVAIDPPAVEVEVKAKDGTVTKQPAAISNIAVDRTTGNLLAFINGAGLWKSTDGGKTWEKIYESKGSCASTHSLLIDPADGKRIFCLLTGAPSAITLDGGKKWIEVKHNNYAGIVAWNDPEAATLLARASGHETWKISTDQGKTWGDIKSKDVQWTFTMGLFDAKTVIGVASAIYKCDDGNGTFAKVGEAKSRGYVVCPMVAVKDHGYVLVTEGLAVSTDKGGTWKVLPVPADISVGPYVGKDESQLVLASAKNGFFESKDGGKTWNKVVGMPIAVHDIGGNMNHGDNGTCGYDPVKDTFYLCSRGSPVYKFQRPAGK